MRKNIVAGNWKMNNTFSETKELLSELHAWFENHPTQTKIILSPAFPFLHLAKEMMGKSILVAAQDCSAKELGAFTGEVSVGMLHSIGVDAIIIGHSERRQYHNETEVLLKNKVELTIKHGLIPIYCVGETLEQRKGQNHFSVIENQMKKVLFDFSTNQLAQLVIAYEPVWAIGTGETASPEQAQEIHEFIRKLLGEQFGKEFANNTSILYGGSVKPNNAREIFSQSDVDGGLIGGACLVAEDFVSIIKSIN